MCCFSNTVLDVSNTKIFCRLKPDGSQIVVYEMEYESEKPNAMILPVPTQAGTKEEDIRFTDLSNYANFFWSLAKGFPKPAPPIWVLGSKTLDTKSGLAIKEVGEFVASVVPTVNDFGRLDPRFRIEKDVWLKIPEYANYSFVVFQLNQLSGKPHPMAFEFPSSLPNQLFFPTVHIHDGQLHEKEEFDHILYAQSETLDSIVGRYRTPRHVDSNSKLTRSKKTASEFVSISKARSLVEGDLLVHRRRMTGILENTDILISVNADDYPRSFSTMPWLVGGTVGAVIGPLAWIIGRRMKAAGKQGKTL